MKTRLLSGKAADEVVEESGIKEYNVEFRFNQMAEIKEHGVVSKNGKKMTFKNMLGVGWMEWITDEEAAAIEAAKDPMEAPPHPYMEQPENLGKFLWITGPPGRPSSQRDGQVCLLRGRLFLPLQDSLHPSVPTTRRREKSPPRR